MHRTIAHRETLQVNSWRHRQFGGRGFTKVSNQELDGESNLTPIEFKLFTIIVSHAHNETGQTQIPVALLALACGRSVRHTQRVQKSLVDKGKLTIRAGRYDRKTRKSELNTYIVRGVINVTPLKTKALNTLNTPRVPREECETDGKTSEAQTRKPETTRSASEDQQGLSSESCHHEDPTAPICLGYADKTISSYVANRKGFRPHVGRCNMRFVEALRISTGASIGQWDDETTRLLREQDARYAEWDRELRDRGGVR